jgi:uncharacterized protein YrzB (UPF0473 family)
MADIDDLGDFEEYETVTIVDEDGVANEFVIIDSVSHKGSNYLLVTLAEDDNEDEAFEAAILKEISEEGDEVLFSLVDNENEFNEVAALFMENDGDYGIEV